MDAYHIPRAVTQYTPSTVQAVGIGACLLLIGALAYVTNYQVDIGREHNLTFAAVSASVALLALAVLLRVDDWMVRFRLALVLSLVLFVLLRALWPAGASSEAVAAIRNELTIVATVAVVLGVIHVTDAPGFSVTQRVGVGVVLGGVCFGLMYYFLPTDTKLPVDMQESTGAEAATASAELCEYSYCFGAERVALTASNCDAHTRALRAARRQQQPTLQERLCKRLSPHECVYCHDRCERREQSQCSESTMASVADMQRDSRTQVVDASWQLTPEELARSLASSTVNSQQYRL